MKRETSRGFTLIELLIVVVVITTLVGLVFRLAGVGEETGALAEMLTRIANTYDDEVDNAVAGMTAAIEPALIIVLAVVVGTIVIAMFLPMIKIISSVSGAGA